MVLLPRLAPHQQLTLTGHSLKRPFDPLTPLGAARHCVGASIPDIGRAVLGHGFNYERGLQAVLFSLDGFRPVAAAVRNDQLVYGEFLGPWDLHKDTIPIEGDDVDRRSVNERHQL